MSSVFNPSTKFGSHDVYDVWYPLFWISIYQQWLQTLNKHLISPIFSQAFISVYFSLCDVH